MSLPTLRQFDTMFPTELSCLTFLVENGVFYRTIQCPGCERPMKQLVEKGLFRCQTTRCKRRQLSIRKNSFFYGHKLECRQILRLALLWLARVNVSSAVLLTGHGRQLICDFYNHFRQLVSSALSIEDTKIGGVNIEVEIDETKLGKVKYHRGHRVEGVWVLVGIERTDQKKIFLVPVETRDKESLMNIITTHVLPGSIIMTDCWKGYVDIVKYNDYKHFTVNHKYTFKDPETGTCTNAAEGLNSGLKRRIPVRNRTKNGIDLHLAEYIWTRQNAKNLWPALIDALANVHYQ